MNLSRDDAKKAQLGDVGKLVDFFSTNNFSEYDRFEVPMDDYYKEMIMDFIRSDSKFLYFFESVERGKLVGALAFEVLPFDTELFGVKSMKLTDIVVSKSLGESDSEDIVMRALDLFLENVDEQEGVFLQAKIDHRKSELAQALEKKGFRSVSKDITLSRKLEDFEKHKHEYQVAFCEGKDVDALYGISKEAYSTTRFHNDPEIPDEKANELQALWAKNCYYQGLADEIILVKKKNEVCGYVCAKIEKEPKLQSGKIGRIVLIAADKKFRGEGVGQILLEEASSWFKEHGCSVVAVETQSTNAPAIKAYQKGGFDLLATKLSFHRWVK